MAPKVKVKILVAQSCQILCDSWIVAHQAPLSIEFSRQEYWSGLPVPSSGDLPDPGIEARSPALQVDSLPSEPPGKSQALSKKNVAWWMYWCLHLHHMPPLRLGVGITPIHVKGTGEFPREVDVEKDVAATQCGNIQECHMCLGCNLPWAVFHEAVRPSLGPHLSGEERGQTCCWLMVVLRAKFLGLEDKVWAWCLKQGERPTIRSWDK